MVPQNSLITNFLQNIFLCVQQNKDIHTGLEQNFHFWVNYPFKLNYDPLITIFHVPYVCALTLINPYIRKKVCLSD